MSGLVLASGDYYPARRWKKAFFSPPAVPLLGGILNRTITPLIGEAPPQSAGDADEAVSFRQAQRLHGDVAGSILGILPGGSHMVHHVAPERVLHAIVIAAAKLERS